MKPWEPQKGESMPAYQAFADYRDMGLDRSQEAVAAKLTKSRQLLGRWASRWNWVERVGAYDAHMAAIEQRGREKALSKKAEDWATKELEMAELLYEKAKAMLRFPLIRRTSGNGQTVVEPAEWRMRDAAAIAEAGVKMERLARGESTDNTKVTFEERRAKLAKMLGVPLEEVPIDGEQHVT